MDMQYAQHADPEAEWVVSTPPQCPYKRASTWTEILFGWMWNFDHEHGTKCRHYAGHTFFSAMNPSLAKHEDTQGNQWE